MMDVSTIQFGVDDDSLIRIHLHRRPYPTASDLWDRDVIDATLQACSGAFQAHVSTCIWSYELEELHRLLIDLDQQVGHEEHRQFTLREHTLSLHFVLTKLGHLHIHAEVKEMNSSVDPTTLTFTIGEDQTFLSRCITQVRKALEIFPPVRE